MCATGRERTFQAAFNMSHRWDEARGRVTRAELEGVARVYREHVGATPTRAVQLAGGYSERTAARRVQQARAAGLLLKTTPGKRKAKPAASSLPWIGCAPPC